MVNDGGNENGKTNTQTKKTTCLISNNNKNNNKFARAAHFFLHFFVVVLHDYSVKLSSYTFHGGNVSCSHKKFCFLCSCSLFFSLPLIFTILAAKIYHFHFQIWLSLLRLGFVVVVFFLFLKVRVAKMTITATFIIMLNTGCSLDTRKQIISHWLPYGADGRTGGRAEGRKGVRSRDIQNFSHAWITKFLTHGALLVSSAIRVLITIRTF